MAFSHSLSRLTSSSLSWNLSLIHISALYGGPKTCSFACIGLGDCTKVCKFDAIHIDVYKRQKEGRITVQWRE